MHTMLLTGEILDKLFTRYYTPLCQLSYSIVKNMDTAKDIVQEFYIKFWNKYENQSYPENFEAYAYVSIRNRTFNYLESSQVKKKHETAYVTDDVELDYQLMHHQNSQQNDYRIKVMKAIDKLPAQQRKTFLLSTMGGKKYAEIAEELNVSINTVKTHIKKAYLSIRKDCNMITALLLLLFFVNNH
jgi:RNA polymerase sigma-70 factor (family 1)